MDRLKKIAKFFLKTIAIIAGVLLLVFVVLRLYYNEDIPKGQPGQPADELAMKMLKSIDHKSFTKTKEIHWTFGPTSYEWRLQEYACNVMWDNYKVFLTTRYPQASFVFKDGKKIDGKEKEVAIAAAEKKFNNDSFWLAAPHKVFDTGVQRELVQADGKNQLKITYTTGGTTPGDVYVWELNNQYQPISLKMWVSILPLQGVQSTWSNWQKTEAGFYQPQQRDLAGVPIPITNVKVIP